MFNIIATIAAIACIFLSGILIFGKKISVLMKVAILAYCFIIFVYYLEHIFLTL